MLRLAQDNLSAHEKILNDFHLISQIDTGRRIDLNQAQVRYDNARLAVIRIETDLRTAVERVARLFVAPAPIEPSGIEHLPAVPYTTLDQAQADLNDQQPAIARLLAQCEAAQASVRYAQAQRALTVNLSHSKTIIPGMTENLYVTQLQLNLPLIDGGTARGAVEVAQANLLSLQADLAETRLLLQEQLAATWINWHQSQQRAELGQAQARTAQELTQGYEQQFRAGRRALLDLLNIQSDLYLYKSNAATALHDARLSQVRILANLGQLAKAYTAMTPSITSIGPGMVTLGASPLSTYSE
jgi:adhesin transport system outer membrane protein